MRLANASSTRDLADKRKIFVLVCGEVDGQVTGPGIRGWEIAKALSDSCSVTVAADTDRVRALDGIRVIPARRWRILLELFRHDVFIGAWPPPYVLAAAALARTMVVADLYDPADLELRTAFEEPRYAEEHRAVTRLTRLQVRHCDALMFASDEQRREVYVHLQDEIFRRRDRRDLPSVAIVPMGIASRPQPTLERPIRKLLSEIGEQDRVILWWGSLWRWLDPETAVRSIALLKQEVEDVKLVFTAARPNPRVARLALEGPVREMARDLGLLGRNVFFVDVWIPYDQRYAWLAEADLALTLHRDPAEARVAARARYMDYLWAEAPCILSEGDDMAQQLADCGLAQLVPVGDASAVADALKMGLETVGSPSERDDRSVLYQRSQWSSVVRPLAALVRAEDALPLRVSAVRALRTLASATAYYVSRAIGLLRAWIHSYWSAVDRSSSAA